MKKILFFILSIFMLFSISAQNIIVLHAGDSKLGDTSAFQIATDELRKFYPNVKIIWSKLDLTDGSTLTMDAMLAAGTPPNLYLDSTVRAGKYLLPEYALPLNGLVNGLDKFAPGVLDPFTKNGKVLGIPYAGSSQGMCINLDVMKEIGFTVKPDWTIADFLKMAELVKQKYGGKKWATGMFAANQSGDYLLNNWYASFGVKWYENGDYDKALVYKNGGAKVYEFYQTLVKNGYVPPNSANLNDDDYAAMWAEGKLVATAFFPPWCDMYFDTAIKQKLIDKPFNYAFVPFPRAPGVTKVGTYNNSTVAIVHKTGTNIDTVVAKLVEILSSASMQDKLATIGVFPNRVDAKPVKDQYIAQVVKIVNENGIHDFGLTDRRFTERRAQQYPILQQVLNLKISPEEASKKFEAALNSVK